MDKYIESNKCMLPWTSIETRPNGGYKPCCLYRDEIKDSTGKPYNTTEHTLSEVMASPAMEKLREEFRQGKRPSACSSCWKEEDVGKTSKRQHMWHKAHMLGQYHLEKDIVEPRFIDLKLGNICNLKCRICSPHSSSQWVNDMIKLDPRGKKRWTDYNKRGLWPKQENKFMKDLVNHIESIRFFEITGGEPLMIQQQFDVLKKCVESGVSKKIEVHYNTNGTQYPEEALMEIWPHFKRIEIAFSIDDINERFEYQRHPANWNDVNTNIQKFINSGLQNMSLQICTTINICNILHLKDLAQKVQEWNPDFWYINVLHHPEEFDVQQLPMHIKEKIKSQLSNPEIYPKEIETAITYMMQEPQEKVNNWFEQFQNKIKQIDTIRKENFGEVFPLLNKVLQIYD